MNALEFTIKVRTDGAVANVQNLSVKMQGLSGIANQLKTISLVQLAQGIANVNQELQAGIAPGADYDQQLADLEAITGITGKDLKDLGETARAVGKETGLGAAMAIEAYKLLASNIDVSVIGGVKGLKMLQKETITLAQAAGVDLPTAANTMAFAINQFKQPATEAGRIINVLGAGAKYGAAEIPDLAASLKEAGSVAADANVSIESTVGAIEVLSQRGLKGAEAGTTLRNVLLKLQTEQIPGVNLKAEGLNASLLKMQKYLGNTVALEKIFGRENITAAQILISSADAVATMTERVTGTNVAYEQAAIRTRTYKTELARIRSQIDDFKISIFEATGSFLPWIEITGKAAGSVANIAPALYFMQAPLQGTIGHIKKLIIGLKGAKTAQQALNIVFMQSPIGWILLGVTALTIAIIALKNRTRELTFEQKILGDVNAKAAEYSAKEHMEIDRLFESLRKTNPKSKERKNIIDELIRRYPDLLKNMNLERATAEDIAKAYQLVTAEVDRMAKAKALEEGLTDAYKLKLQARAEYEEADKKFQREGGGYYNELEREKAYDKSVEATNYLNEFKLLVEKEMNTAGPSLDKPGSLTTGGLGSLRDNALNSISGDTKAIKNINITIGSMIGENNIYNDPSGMSITTLQKLVEEALLRALNDVNYAA